MHAITSREAAYERTGPQTSPPNVEKEKLWQVLVGAAADGELSLPYRSTTTAPAAAWVNDNFNDAAWQKARAPFGTIVNPRTRWTTSDIWLRRTFEWNGAKLSDAALVIFHDEDTEVYVNGEKIWSGSGYKTAYEMYSVHDTLKRALRKGSNVIAVHTHQTGGGQFIDLALLVTP